MVQKIPFLTFQKYLQTLKRKIHLRLIPHMKNTRELSKVTLKYLQIIYKVSVDSFCLYTDSTIFFLIKVRFFF